MGKGKRFLWVSSVMGLGLSGFLMFGPDQQEIGAPVGNQRIESFESVFQDMKAQQAALNQINEQVVDEPIETETDEETIYRQSFDKTLDETVTKFIESENQHYILPRTLTRDELETFNRHETFDLDRFNYWLLHYVNELRDSEGVTPLVYGPHLAEGGAVRTKELARDGSIYVIDHNTGELNPEKHIRPAWENYSPWHTAFNVPSEHSSLGENLAMRSWTGNKYLLASEKRLAEIAFTDWENSPGHRENMVHPNHRYMYGDVRIAQGIRTGEALDGYMAGYIFGQWFSN